MSIPGIPSCYLGQPCVYYSCTIHPTSKIFHQPLIIVFWQLCFETTLPVSQCLTVVLHKHVRVLSHHQSVSLWLHMFLHVYLVPPSKCTHSPESTCMKYSVVILFMWSKFSLFLYHLMCLNIGDAWDTHLKMAVNKVQVLSCLLIQK